MYVDIPTGSRLPHNIQYVNYELHRWPSGSKRDCYAKGFGFDSQVEQKVLLGFSMIFSSSSELGFVPG